MKVKELTVVIGAGGSKPYDFPTGKELKTLTIEALSEAGTAFHSIMQVADRFGFNGTDVNEFCVLLVGDSLNESVDAFIQSQSDHPKIETYSAIAKCITALLIARCEKQERLTDDDWYMVLLRKMFNGNNTLETFKDNRVNFITFNFDRSLEKYFILKLSQQFGKTEQEITEYLNVNFKFIHIHGSLGTLWADNDGRTTSYKTTFSSPEDLFEAAKNIKFITDDMSPQEEMVIERAKEVVANSDLVTFLGVGYHAINMQRLGLGGGNETVELPNNKFFGTVSGLTPIEIRQIEARYSLNQFGSAEEPGATQSISSQLYAKQIFDYVPTDWYL